MSKIWTMEAVCWVQAALKGLVVLHCTNLHKMTMFFNIPFNFFYFSLKKTIITKHRTLQKYSTLAFISPLMGPGGLVRLQPTSTLSAGNLISISHYTFYCASVNFKWDGCCREWIVEGQKWETLKITYTIPSEPFYHITQKHICKRERASVKQIASIWYNLALTTRLITPRSQFFDRPRRRIALLDATEPRPTHTQCCYKYIKNGLSI